MARRMAASVFCLMPMATSCVWQPSAIRSASARRMSLLSGVALLLMVRVLCFLVFGGEIGGGGVEGESQAP